MSIGVDVDLRSAVVNYRPVASEERSISASEAAPNVLFCAAPWRTFRRSRCTATTAAPQ
jgi:hypothetical protein